MKYLAKKKKKEKEKEIISLNHIQSREKLDSYPDVQKLKNEHGMEYE